MSLTSSKTKAKPNFKAVGLLLVAVTSVLFFWWITTSDRGQTPESNSGGMSQSADKPTAKAIDEAYGQVEMSFEANQGQTDESVDFLARGVGYTLFLKPDEATFSLSIDQNKGNGSKNADSQHRQPRKSTPVRLKLIGGNATAEPVGRNQLEGKTNYFIGNDPGKWRTNVPKLRSRSLFRGL